MLEEELSIIKGSLLTDEQKTNILIYNGLNILRKVNPRAYSDIQVTLSKTPFELKRLNSHNGSSLQNLVNELLGR